MKKWITVETHTHTLHSDAQFSVKELLEAAQRYEIDVVCMTDHNTDSGIEEARRLNLSSPKVVPGIEWTSFYGHCVIHGANHFVDFRDLEPDNLEEHIQEVHDEKGIAICAHPFNLGKPFCCGCRWCFDVKDWSNLDGFEIWSDAIPSHFGNDQAYHFWREKIREGYKLTALSARDWHSDDGNKTPHGINYMLMDQDIDVAEAEKDCIRNHHSYMTLGPTVSFTLNNQYEIGDTVPAGEYDIKILVSDKERCSVWKDHGIDIRTIRLYQNDTLTEIPFEGFNKAITRSVNMNHGPLHLELWGFVGGEESIIALTNPFFVA